MKPKRIIAGILFISVICSRFSVPSYSVYAEEEPMLIEAETLDGKEAETGEVPENEGYHTLSYALEPVEYIQPYSLVPSTTASSLPSRYDARQYGRITSVKNQNPYGTCWAFAAINSAEADAVVDGRMEAASADLSEAQLAYFFYHRVPDPLGGTDGDIVSTSGNYLSIGGNNQLSTFALATWISPAEESVMGYSGIGSYSPANVSPELAYTYDAAHLQNAYWISMSDVNTIKQMLMEYGTVATSYYSANSYYQNRDGSCYYYYPFDTTQNHAVSIVGWDDTIPADKFSVTVDKVTYTPSNAGGWLIKNSYGAGWGDEGYFWISYEDKGIRNVLFNNGTLNSNLGVVFDYESADNYDNNYQYDGTVSVSQLQYQSLSVCYTANVFTTQAEEDLKAVGFYTTQPGMTYQIQIYRNLPDHSPVGTPALSVPVMGVADYAGYHTVSLGPGIALTAGETYSVVLQYRSASSGVSFFIDKSNSYGWTDCISDNKAGQGYYSGDGKTWRDCSTDYNANLRIKAFTNYHSVSGSQTSFVPTAGITLSPASCSIGLNGTLALAATLCPANATNQNVSWSSSDPSVAAVNSNGVVTAKSVGTAVITARTSAGGHRAVCQVTVYSQTQSFCARLYEKCLGRQAEADGLAYWSQVLISREKSGAQVGYGFVFSDEYKNKHTSDDAYIEMLYQVFMNRASDASGKNYWLGILSQGVSREYVYQGFAHSQEYTNICNSYGIDRGSVTLTQARDKNPNLTAFVNRIYEKAMERKGEEDGLNYWCSMIQSGARTPVQAAEFFLTSQEFRNKNLSNEAYIRVLYRTFMDRECDQGGLNYWLGELNRGCSREDVLRRFAGCPEFKNIIASFGL